MRLLTHNTLRNNSAAAKGKGFPLGIMAAEVRVDDGVEIHERNILFIKRMLTILDWPALVQVRTNVSVTSLTWERASRVSPHVALVLLPGGI
jgi:hypothetical protein